MAVSQLGVFLLGNTIEESWVSESGSYVCQCAGWTHALRDIWVWISVNHDDGTM